MQLFHPLDVGQLVRSQQAATQLRVGVRRKRVRLNQVGDEAVEKPAPLIGDVAQLERPLRASEPGSEPGSLTALLFAGGASSCCWSSMLRALSLGHHM